MTATNSAPKPIFFSSPQEFYDWLEEHHESEEGRMRRAGLAAFALRRDEKTGVYSYEKPT